MYNTSTLAIICRSYSPIPIRYRHYIIMQKQSAPARMENLKVPVIEKIAANVLSVTVSSASHALGWYCTVSNS